MDPLLEVSALEEEQRRAFVARDIERLRALWSEGLLVNSPLNQVVGREKILELLAAGTIAHVSYDGTTDRIEARGDIVAVMGGERIVNQPGGPVIHRRFTDVWRREGGSWRMILRHANLAPGDRGSGAPPAP